MTQELDYAVVIGIEHYKGIDPLGGPHGDTKKFVQWLIDPAGGQLPHDGSWTAATTDKSPSENILLLLSTPQYTPTKDDVDDWIGDVLILLRRAGKRGRRLYFYFSGHGIGHTNMNSAMLLPKWTYENRNYALSSESYLTELSKKGSFEQLFFFMDCCRNRITGVQGQGPPWTAVAAADDPCDYLCFYASEFANPAYEVSQYKDQGILDNLLPRGLFTEVLLNGLRGAAADRNGNLTVTDLTRYVKLKLPELASTFNKVQFPRDVISFSGDGQITEPFSKTVAVAIDFKTPGLDMVLEDPDLNVVRTGNSSNGSWPLELRRGNYILRKADESNGMKLYIDGLQTNYSYE